MKKFLLTLLLTPFIFGQMRLLAMDFQKTIVVRITDIAGPKTLRYTLQVPYYEENKKVYVLINDLYNAMNKQHDTKNSHLFRFLYYPDGKDGFVDYNKKRILLDLKSLDDIIVAPFDEDV